MWNWNRYIRICILQVAIFDFCVFQELPTSYSLALIGIGFSSSNPIGNIKKINLISWNKVQLANARTMIPSRWNKLNLLMIKNCRIKGLDSCECSNQMKSNNSLLQQKINYNFEIMRIELSYSILVQKGSGEAMLVNSWSFLVNKQNHMLIWSEPLF